MNYKPISCCKYVVMTWKLGDLYGKKNIHKNHEP